MKWVKKWHEFDGHIHRYNRVSDWHYWFAWHPVRVGREWRWLELVLRRVETQYADTVNGNDAYFRRSEYK